MQLPKRNLHLSSNENESNWNEIIKRDNFGEYLQNIRRQLKNNRGMFVKRSRQSNGSCENKRSLVQK